MNIHEDLPANSYRWEQRGRGIGVFPAAVELEPRFLSFPGHRLRLGNEGLDSGVKPSLFSGLADKVFRAEWQEPEPDWFGEKEPVMEFPLGLPGGASYAAEAMGHFLRTC